MTGPDLRAWRTTNRFTQPALGSCLGVTANTIYRWEAGLYAIPPFLSLALMWIVYDRARLGETT